MEGYEGQREGKKAARPSKDKKAARPSKDKKAARPRMVPYVPRNACVMCGMKFRNSATFKAHVDAAVRGGPPECLKWHRCPQCMSGFSTAVNLNKHVKAVHTTDRVNHGAANVVLQTPPSAMAGRANCLSPPSEFDDLLLPNDEAFALVADKVFETAQNDAAAVISAALMRANRQRALGAHVASAHLRLVSDTRRACERIQAMVPPDDVESAREMLADIISNTATLRGMTALIRAARLRQGYAEQP
jgi:uncharacterized C2H2 Zn-finger protein